MVDTRLVKASFSCVTMDVSAPTMEANLMLESDEDGGWSCDLRGERMEAGLCTCPV